MPPVPSLPGERIVRALERAGLSRAHRRQPPHHAPPRRARDNSAGPSGTRRRQGNTPRDSQRCGHDGRGPATASAIWEIATLASARIAPVTSQHAVVNPGQPTASRWTLVQPLLTEPRPDKLLAG